MSSTQPQRYRDACANRRIWLKDRRHHPNVERYWPECIAVDAMSRDDLLALQRARLAALIEHACSHVPFYRDWCRANGFGPDRLPRLEDLPLTNKDHYRDHRDAFQSDAFPAESMKRVSTSGSTGVPFTARAHADDSDYSYCCLWRALGRHGIRPGDRRVYIWGQRGRFEKHPIRRLRTRLHLAARDWLNNTLTIDAADLKHDSIPRHLDAIERFKPVFLHGYVSSLYAIARRMLADDRQLRGVKMRGVVTESEQIEPFQKKVMHDAFGCPILEHYGSVEFGNMAQTDPQGHLRVNEDMVLIETLPTGEAAITKLLGHAYPFIRYKLGDMMSLTADPPGPLPYACIARITGRVADLIVLPGGDYIAGLELNKVVRPHERFVHKYQIRQTAVDAFIISIVPSQPLPERLQQQMVSELRQLVGENASVRIDVLEDIPPEKSGKFRVVISDVAETERAAAIAADVTDRDEQS